MLVRNFLISTTPPNLSPCPLVFEKTGFEFYFFFLFFLPAGQKERENKIETKYGVYDTHVPGVSVLHFCLPPMVGVATQSA